MQYNKKVLCSAENSSVIWAEPHSRSSAKQFGRTNVWSALPQRWALLSCWNIKSTRFQAIHIHITELDHFQRRAGGLDDFQRRAAFRSNLFFSSNLQPYVHSQWPTTSNCNYHLLLKPFSQKFSRGVFLLLLPSPHNAQRQFCQIYIMNYRFLTTETNSKALFIYFVVLLQLFLVTILIFVYNCVFRKKEKNLTKPFTF